MNTDLVLEVALTLNRSVMVDSVCPACDRGISVQMPMQPRIWEGDCQCGAQLVILPESAGAVLRNVIKSVLRPKKIVQVFKPLNGLIPGGCLFAAWRSVEVKENQWVFVCWLWKELKKTEEDRNE